MCNGLSLIKTNAVITSIFKKNYLLYLLLSLYVVVLPLFYWMDFMDILFWRFSKWCTFVGMPVITCRDRVLLCMKQWSRICNRKLRSHSKGLMLVKSYLPFSFSFFLWFMLHCTDFPELWTYTAKVQSGRVEISSNWVGFFFVMYIFVSRNFLCFQLDYVSIPVVLWGRAKMELKCKKITQCTFIFCSNSTFFLSILNNGQNQDFDLV